MASTGKPAFKQTAFTGGEIAPDAQGRTDVERLRTGVNRCLNFIPMVSGGAITRPGTEYIAASIAGSRLIPFVFNEDQAYIIEIRPKGVAQKVGRLRVYRDGAVIDDPDNPGNPLELSSPWKTADEVSRIRYAQLNDIMWLTSQGSPVYELRRYADDDWRIAAIDLEKDVNAPATPSLKFTRLGLPEINWDTAASSHPARNYAWVVTAVDAYGTESLPSGAYETNAALLYDTLPTFTGLPTLEWDADADGNTPVGYNIYRGDNSGGIFGWVGYVEHDALGGPGGSGGAEWQINTNAPDYGNGPSEGRTPFVVEAERLPGDSVTAAFGALSGDGWTPGTTADASKTTVAEAFNDRYQFTVVVIASGLPGFPSPTLSLDFKAELSSGAGFAVYKSVDYADIITPFEGGVTVVEDVYIDGMTNTGTFRVEVTAGNAPGGGDQAELEDAVDVSWQEAQVVGPDVPSYPNAVTLFEQRLVFGGFSRNPSQLQTSRTGDLDNFDVSAPSQDTDALDFLLASNKLNEIRALLPLDALMVFTAGAEWIVRGTEGGAWTPTNFDFKPRSHNGISWCEPVLVGSSVLIVVPQASSIREIRYDKEVNVSSDKNLTVLAQHLLRNYDLLEVSYQESPFNCVWWTRDDGTIIGLTYSKEYDIWGFHRHTTDGKFRSVATIPESENENKRMRSTLTTPQANADPRTTLSDFTYVIVERDIDGSTVYYIERFSNRFAPDSKDLILSDSALVFDGRGDYNTTVTPSTATTWTIGSVITLSASANAFFAGDVGSKYELTDNDPNSATYGSSYRFTITGYSSPTSIATTADQDVPAGLQGVATNIHGLAVNSVSGLTHLEGESVNVVIDGSESGDKIVSSGAITTDTYGVRIQVGLNYNCELDTLNIHSMQDAGAGRIEQKIISRVGIEVDNWRGLYVGNEEDYLSEVMDRSVADGFEAVNPVNTVIEVRPEDTWDMTKRIFIRQTKPLPCTVVAIIPEVSRDG